MHTWCDITETHMWWRVCGCSTRLDVSVQHDMRRRPCLPFSRTVKILLRADGEVRFRFCSDGERTGRDHEGAIPCTFMSSVAGGKRPLSALCTYVSVCVCVQPARRICVCATAGEGRRTIRGTYISTREQYKLQVLSKAQQMCFVDQLDVDD